MIGENNNYGRDIGAFNTMQGFKNIQQKPPQANPRRRIRSSLKKSVQHQEWNQNLNTPEPKLKEYQLTNDKHA